MIHRTKITFWKKIKKKFVFYPLTMTHEIMIFLKNSPIFFFFNFHIMLQFDKKLVENIKFRCFLLSKDIVNFFYRVRTLTHEVRIFPKNSKKNLCRKEKFRIFFQLIFFKIFHHLTKTASKLQAKLLSKNLKKEFS